MISDNLEKGKCGEYFALYELIKQGYIAFPSDQGLPYDILVDCDGVVLRGQVKTTKGHSDYGKSMSCLRFGTRNGKGTLSNANTKSCDFYAFVSIDDKVAAFFHVSELQSKKNQGSVKQTIDMRSRSSGYTPKKGGGRMLVVEDFDLFSRVEGIHFGFN